MGDEVEPNADANAEAPVEESFSQGHPAWQGLLDVIPTQLHGTVTPFLKEWDDNFSKVQTEYSPYKAFADQGLTPDQIQQALYVNNILNTNPRGVYDRMVETFGGEWGLNNPNNGIPEVQGQQQNGSQEQDFSGVPDFSNSQEFDIASHPQFQQLQQQNEVVVQYLAQQLQQQENAKADQELDIALKSLHEKHGDFDEQMAFGLVQGSNGAIGLEDAVQRVVQYRGSPANAPNILTPGGGLPTQHVDVASLDDKGRKSLVMQMLAQAKNSGD